MSRPLTTKGLLRKAAEGLSLVDYLDYRDFLRHVYERRKAAADLYSFEQFAADLGIGKSNFIRFIIAGRRRLSAAHAECVAETLGLANAGRQYFLTLVRFNDESETAGRDELFAKLLALRAGSATAVLDDEQLAFFGEWANSIISEMANLGGFEPDAEWIRQHLNFPLKVPRIRKSLEFLQERGFIRFNAKTKAYERTSRHLSTTREVDSHILVAYHQKMLQLAGESITRVDETHRDVTALTTCIPDEMVDVVKSLVSDMLQKIAKLSELTAGKKQVYQVNVQVFPFTKELGK